MSRLIGRISHTEDRKKVTFNPFYQTMSICRTSVFFFAFFLGFWRAKARGLFQALRPLSLFFLFTSPCASGHNLEQTSKARLASTRRARSTRHAPHARFVSLLRGGGSVHRLPLCVPFAEIRAKQPLFCRLNDASRTKSY